MAENSPQGFTFKPALLAKARTFHVFDDRLEYKPKDKPVEITFFKDISATRFAVTTAREYRFRRLDLTRADGEILRINITTSLIAKRANDSDLAAFLAMIETFAEKVSAVRPDLTVTYGETQKATWVMFSIGVLTLLAAGGLLAAAIITRVSEQKLMAALVPMGILVLFGFFICWTSNPFEKKPVLGWDVMGRVVRNLT